VLAVHEAGAPVGFAQLERDGSGIEISDVFVHPEHRGAGRGTALTRAAIEAAANRADLWICADDEDRPKQLYARLGFRPAWTIMQFLRLPAN
jgi:GNAT superfamily N-acetyltransferase